ncbi:unnamed protein product (macronuclear) [Paramecium tetraurelia]|uniref:Uncharacterized protein n=1 Tax=Paramecium tetraurelia TaxID=5888 RepID=A0DNJ5_PARTE|nr:uncharacterized protein GSPATT00018808001 [Paramecium tetraurelia]CAK84612.1 unnamed protein product [Paramecium tetraurelia]|eukprot:XP_001452009.1 hypothetical protein (macronuclear) [Paramecium tetraurelia strain d4-2]
MDSLPTHFRKQKREISQILQSSQNLLQLSQQLVQTSQSEINSQTGPRLNPNQIESKTGDTGDLLESGNLLQYSENSLQTSQSIFLQQFTESGSFLNQYCQHISLTQEVENRLFEQIKQASTCKFKNICTKNCQMKFNPAYTSVQQILLYQLYENQIVELKNNLLKNNSQKLKICDGQGCEFYFILDDQLQKRNYYCPLCLDSFELR